MSPRLKIRNVTLRRRNNIANGDCFQPERWQPNDPDAALLAELFMPFSLGRRNCVGQNLAMLELKMVLSPPLPTPLYPQLSHSVTLLLAPSPSPCFLLHPSPTLSISGRRCQLAWEVWSGVACLSDCSSDTGLGAASAALQLWAGGPWSKIRTLPHLQAQGCPAPRQSSLGYVICSNLIAQVCSDWYWGIISLKVLDKKIEPVER